MSRTGAVSSTTLYQYSVNGRLLEETDEQGNPLVDYIYLDNRPVATISPPEGKIYFLHNDRLGTPQVATDGMQSIVWSAGYGPFGEMTAIPGLIVQNLRLPGQEFDVETGLYHNGFRDYAPGWGRYLQSDPIGLAGGMNTYAYAGANPVNRIDPLGLDFLDDLKVNAQNFSNWSQQQLSDLQSWSQVQWAEIQASPSGYFQTLPCVVEVKKLYDEAIQEIQKYGPISDALDIIEEVWGAAKGEMLAILKLAQRLYANKANDPTQPWGDRCPPTLPQCRIDPPLFPPQPPPPPPPSHP